MIIKPRLFACVLLALAGCTSVTGVQDAVPHYTRESTFTCPMPADVAANKAAEVFTSLGFSSFDWRGEGRPVKPARADALSAAVFAITADRSRLEVRCSLNDAGQVIVVLKSDLNVPEHELVAKRVADALANPATAS